MRILARTLLLLPLFLAALAAAQTPSNNIPQVQHVIIVIQENRTPTNLFQQDTALVTNGAHIVFQGYCGSYVFSLQPDNIFTCYDPSHNHSKLTSAWTTMWDGGKMDGACQTFVGG